MLQSTGLGGTTFTTTNVDQTAGSSGSSSDWHILYTADDVLATYSGAPLPIEGFTPNQAAIAAALNIVLGSGAHQDISGAFLGAPITQVLDEFSSEGYADFGTAALANGAQFSNAVFTALQGIQPGLGSYVQTQRVQLAANEPWHIGSPANAPWGAWLSGVGTIGSFGGNVNTHDFSYSAGGGAAGLDYRFNPNFTAGIAAGAMSTDFSLVGLPQTGTLNSYQFAAYGGWHSGRLYVDGLAGFAYDTDEMRRTIMVPGISGTATGNADGGQFLGAAEIGYAFSIGPQSFMTPFADVTGGIANLNSFTETGPTPVNLSVADHATPLFQTVLGVQMSTALPIGLPSPVAVMARLGWAHEFGDVAGTVTASFAAAPGASFTVAGAPSLRDAAQTSVGAQLPLTANAAVFLRYDGEYGGNGRANAVTGGFRVTW